MAAPHLTIRSAKARDLAHRLASRENCSIADIVERALEAFEIRQAESEPAAVFYQRLAENYATDADLGTILEEHRKPHPGLAACT